MSKGLSGWRSWTAESVARKRGLRKAVLRMQLVGLSSAFAAWHERAVSAKTLAASASRVIARLLSSCVVGAYARWMEYAAQSRRVKRVGLRLQNLGVSRALLAWVDAVETSRWEQEQGALKRADEAHSQSLALMRAEIDAQRQAAVASICVRWLRQGVSKCWMSWCSVVSRKHAVAKALRRLVHARLYAAVGGWRASAASTPPRAGGLRQVVPRAPHRLAVREHAPRS